MMLRKLFNFFNDRGGNIMPMFALSLIPVVGMVGVAVDYSRANGVKASMQSALDSTSLAMASSAATLNPDDLKTQSKAYFEALFKKPGTTGVEFHADYTTTGGTQLVLSAATSIKTDFLNIPGIGIEYIPISAQTTSAWGNSRLRVALALDNTGSMAQLSKLTTLKTAAKNLIDQLSAAAKTPGDVYVSIIPFTKDVNVGTGNVNASWIKWSGASDTWEDVHGSCNHGNYTTRVTCQAAGTCSLSQYTSSGTCGSHGTCTISTKTSQSTCTSSGTCSVSNKTTQSACSSAHGTWTAGVWTGATWTPYVWTATTNHSSWNGCVMDRDQQHDVDNAAASSGDTTTLFPAENFAECPVEIMPLSYNWTNLKTKIDSMVANGNTNTTIGLEWAWHSLSQDGPFSAPAEDANYTYKKVIIFLTDGDNTQNRLSSTQSTIDARMTAACGNAKTAGVEIYTILVIQGSASLLQNCASNASGTTDHFFNVTASNQLVSVFNQIGTKLAKLHVAK